jgi:hypothetical protein
MAVASDCHAARLVFTSASVLIESALANHQVQTACATRISDIPVRSPRTRLGKGAGWPTDQEAARGR